MITQGMRIAGRYEIIGKVGAGGMSDVYKAMDHTLGRYVAIKVLKSEFSEDLNFVTKFRTEAQSAAGLEHPNIVNIYDVGSENEFHYIVMELVEGITLKTYIEKKGQLSFKEAVSIAIQVGRGIEAAHNKNIIHRDIKPQNIIISTEGKVKVTDFGIAKAVSSNTISSDVMGSVHYSSPEQARNGFIDGKSDIYSLGIVMYEMVTGRVPFDGDTTVAVAIQHLQEEMESPKTYAPDLPVSMEKIILKCTQKNPDRRYENITALLSDLRKALISPDEDFVVIAPIPQDKTRIIGADEVDKIKQKTGSIYVDEEALVGSALSEEEGYEPGDEDPDDIDDDEEVNPVMDKAITIAGIVAGIIIVILIIVILVNFIGGFRSNNNAADTQQQSTTTETQVDSEVSTEGDIEIVDLRGLTFDAAKEILNADGLGIKKAGTEASDEYAEGEIISHTPDEGTFVTANTMVEVIVSSGPAKINIPSVKGLTEEEAIKKLEEEGFEVNVTYDNSSSVAAGNVISQTPGANSLGNEGDTVTIVVSEGPEIVLVKVPSVLGLTKDSATQTLTAAGLVVGDVKTEYNDTIDKDYVISQSVASDTQVAKDTVVDIVISLGKKPIKVINVVGLTKDSAKSTLQTLGLTVAVEETYSDTVTKGYVISQSIAAETEVPKGSDITITVSLGKKPVKVTNVVNADESTAKSALETLGLKVTVTYEYSDTVAEGKVISQSIAPNSEVESGSSITIVVSKGKQSTGEGDEGGSTGGNTGDSTGGNTTGDNTGNSTGDGSGDSSGDQGTGN